MVLQNRLAAVESLIRQTVRINGELTYRQVLDACNGDMTDSMDTYEQAGRNIAPLAEAIFGALLSNREGIPGSGFFNTYSIHRRADFERLAPGRMNEMGLTLAQKQAITADERNRIQLLHAQRPI